MNVKEDTNAVHFMINNPYAREALKDFAVTLDFVLAVELNTSRFYGKYCSKKEKQDFKALQIERKANKDPNKLDL